MKFDGVKKLMKEGLSADTISIIQLRMTRKRSTRLSAETRI